MSPSKTAVEPSIALGLAAIVALAGLVVTGRLVWTAVVSEEAGEPEACCLVPIEIIDEEGARLGCASDGAVRGCGELLAGDRVVLGGVGCEREAGGMAAAMRLLAGLKIDVNRASAAELELIEGVGPSLARAIVEEREARGRFGAVEEVGGVKGVGEVMGRRLGEYLEVGR